jgi:hypothetical protein
MKIYINRRDAETQREIIFKLCVPASRRFIFRVTFFAVT